MSTSDNEQLEEKPTELSDIESFRQLLTAFPEATDPRGRECADISWDPSWPAAEGVLLDDYLAASVHRVDLDSPAVTSVLTASQFIERWPDDGDDLTLGDDERIEYITVDAPSFTGRTLVLDRSALRAAGEELQRYPDASLFLVSSLSFDAKNPVRNASIIVVGDTFNQLTRCWIGSFDALFEDAVKQVGSGTSKADLFEEMMSSDGKSIMGEAVRRLVEPTRRPEPPPAAVETLLGFGFEPENIKDVAEGRRAILQVTLLREWQDVDSESSYSVCFRSEYGLHDCIATDAPIGADRGDDEFVTSYVFVPKSGVEVWVDRYSEEDSGPRLKLSTINVVDVDRSERDDGVMPILLVAIPAFIEDPERDMPATEKKPDGLQLKVVKS